MDSIEVIAVAFPLITLPKKARTTLNSGVCDDCGFQMFTRSPKAVVPAADDHIKRHEHNQAVADA